MTPEAALARQIERYRRMTGEERLNKFRDQNGPLLARGEVKLPFAKLMLDVALKFAGNRDGDHGQFSRYSERQNTGR